MAEELNWRDFVRALTVWFFWGTWEQEWEKYIFFSEDRICGKRGYFSLFGITLEGVKEL